VYVAESCGLAKYQQSGECRVLMPEFNEYDTHIKVRMWDSSPVTTELLRPDL
jgi:hypothetical protein